MKAAFKMSMVSQEKDESEDEDADDDDSYDADLQGLKEFIRSDDGEELEGDEVLGLYAMFDPDLMDDDNLCATNPLQSGCNAHNLQLTVQDGFRALPVTRQFNCSQYHTAEIDVAYFN